MSAKVFLVFCCKILYSFANIKNLLQTNKLTNCFFIPIGERKCDSHHPTCSDGIDIVLWELLAADVEGVEGISAIGAVLEQVLL